MNDNNSFDSSCSIAAAGARSSTGSISSCGSVDYYDVTLSPTQLLALAIKKRRFLLEDKQRNYQRELLHSHLIQNLCKFLGEGRARVRRRRRSSSGRKLVVVAKRCRWDDDDGIACDGDDGCGDERERRDHMGPDGSRSSPSSSPIPTGLAYESTVQTETGCGDGVGDDGGTQRAQRHRRHNDSPIADGAHQSDSEHGGRPPPTKRARVDTVKSRGGDDDEFTLLDLDDKKGAFADGGRVF